MKRKNNRMCKFLCHLRLSLIAVSGVVPGLSCGGDDIQSPATGGLKVTSVTSGVSLDPDGYMITFDGLDRGAIGDRKSVV